MVVPDRFSRVRHIRVSRKTILTLAGIVFLLLGGTLAAGIHYYSIIDRIGENEHLRQQNLQMRNRLAALHEKVSSIQTALDRVQRLDTKLRTITHLHDPKRHLAIGPYETGKMADANLEDGGSVPPPARVIGENPHLALNLLDNQLDELASKVGKREGSIRQLETYLRGQKTRLVSTPSIWPARGWVTTGFGTRVDPYTGKRTMHRGIDIANQPGVPVLSPARGVVTFTAASGEFGKMVVLDHGYGIRTRYGHLNEFKTDVGDNVERGEIIGTIGNSGRSTGPHLHYEVEVNGICENPKDYMLDD